MKDLLDFKDDTEDFVDVTKEKIDYITPIIKLHYEAAEYNKK